jgi:threonine dehydrogenase-like Zn-dependent dehydrogenase
MGTLLLQFVVRLGAAQVIAIDPRQSARALAAKLGADVTLDPKEADPVEAVLARTGGEGADVVIEATGAQQGLDLATALTRTRGRLVIYGYHQADPRTVEMQLWNLRGLDVVNAHQRDDDDYLAGMRAGLAMLEHGKLDMQSLVTHRFALADIGAAFALADRCPEGFVKAVVVAE